MQSQGKSELVWLTALRGAAALWVVLLHSQSLEGIDYGVCHSLKLFIARGWLGVDLFFLLSGFVLSYSYADKMKTFHWASAKSFWMKRFARVYPTHLAVLLLYIPLVVPALMTGILSDPEGQFTASKFFLQVSLLHGIGMFESTGWNHVSWAVSSEFFVYLLFPFIAVYLLRVVGRLRSTAVAGAILAIGILLSKWVGQPDQYQLPFAYTWFRVLSEFLLGSCLFGFYRTLTPSRGYAGVALLGVAATVLHSWIDNNFYDFLYLIYFMMIVLGLALTPARRKLPLIGALGEMSYSLYLIHAMFIILCNQLYRRVSFFDNCMWGRLTLFLGLSMAAAWVLYRFVENPMRRKIIRRFSRG